MIAMKSYITLIAIVALAAGCSDSGPDGLKEIICWGGRQEASASPPEGLKVKQYAVGGSFSCAIDEQDRLVCWGKPDGEKDIGYSYLSKAPVGAKAKFVDMRDLNGCIITENGLPTCWGYEELGAISVDKQVTYKSLYTAGSTVCALSEAGKVDCWGQNVWSAGWPDVLGTTKVTDFKFDLYNACWRPEEHDGLSCTAWGSSAKEGYTFETKEKILDFGMAPLGDGLWFIDDEHTLNLVEDGKVTAQESNVKGFARDFDTCILDASGKLACTRIGGGTTYPFGPAVNTPKDVKFSSFQLAQPMACGLKE